MATANCATESVQTIFHRTHTRALFLVAFVTFHSCALRMAQGVMSLCESSQNHSVIGHVVVSCSFDSIPSCVSFTFHLTDNTIDLSSAISRNQTKPLWDCAQGWTLWPIGWSDPKHMFGIVNTSPDWKGERIWRLIGCSTESIWNQRSKSNMLTTKTNWQTC